MTNSATDAPTREDYAARLVPIAARLVAAVHDEGPDAVLRALNRARALPTPADGTRVEDALPVILAAMVDPTRTPRQLLAWTKRLDQGSAKLLVARPRLNPAAVELALAGRLPRHALTRPEVDEAERILLRRGWTAEEIAAHLDEDQVGSEAGVAA
ncbi:hypothetical protein MOQ72_42665 [Saccharopolyspora sp. K220]|uniref:hypothetical protein n=1 Tax=Saccharopolyspora soli TaxID=2926618 RepID=UPI001F5A8745|nr:hypothetical protein [Saccharopolyspora soli]MCI2424119.1 hypothetical protein [Saccharopolyspora soli]